MRLPQYTIDQVIQRALEEDINYIDVTTDYLLDRRSIASAKLIAKEAGIIAGVRIARRVFELINNRKLTFVKYFSDGDEIKPGDVIMAMEGPIVTLLKGERTALNLLQHMSGIATATKKAVELVKGTHAVVTDTRKTMPGLRPLQKYAVVVGGGRNHRFNLSDGAMLKDNHIDAYGSLTKAVAALREKVGHMIKIEVETRTLDEVREALSVNADVIMLDNMDCATMKKAVEMTNGAAQLEASGNITLETIKEIAQTGVDILSVGALTHSVKALDISMRIQ